MNEMSEEDIVQADREEADRVLRLSRLTPKSEMVFIDPDIFMIRSPHPVPNIWYRFWQRFFLGVKWKKI